MRFHISSFVTVFNLLVIARLYFNCCSFINRPFDSKNPFLATVTVNRRLNKAGDRHLMHLELDITGSKIR